MMWSHAKKHNRPEGGGCCCVMHTKKQRAATRCSQKHRYSFGKARTSLPPPISRAPRSSGSNSARLALLLEAEARLAARWVERSR
jgi:hypothetical protein